MTKGFSSLLKKDPPMFSLMRGGDDVIMGTVGRMVRNLPGHAFPGWSAEEGRQAVARILLPAVRSLPGFKTGFCAEAKALKYAERRILLERKQITPCLAARQDGCYLLINRAQDGLAMVNEEEHLVIHAFACGLDISGILHRLHSYSDLLEQNIAFAYTRSNGYLTSMPSECGEGLEFFTVLHLPALTLEGRIAQVSKGLEKLHFRLYPLYPGEAGERSNIFLLQSIPFPLGAAEDLSAHLAHITMALADRERSIRGVLYQKKDKSLRFHDTLLRAYGTLRYSRRLEYEEFLQMLSRLRLALDEGIVFSPLKSNKDLRKELLSFYMKYAPWHMGATDKNTDDFPAIRASHMKTYLGQNQLETID